MDSTTHVISRNCAGNRSITLGWSDVTYLPGSAEALSPTYNPCLETGLRKEVRNPPGFIRKENARERFGEKRELIKWQHLIQTWKTKAEPSGNARVNHLICRYRHGEVSQSPLKRYWNKP